MKTALVVGAGVIGRSIAAHLEARGFDVIVATRRDFDLTDDAAIARYFAACPALDVLVNAAGTYGTIGKVGEVTPSEWREAMAVNVFGVYACCHYALPKLVTGSHIINLAGGGAMTPVEHLSSYGASKAALVRMTETLAKEYPKLCVNAISPGPIDSPMQDRLLAAGTKSGPWHEKIKALREKGEGGVPIEKTLDVIDFILDTKQTGQLFFARTFKPVAVAA